MGLEMNEELLLKEPEKIADSIYKNKSPSDTQLRKFFDDFMILKKHADTIYSSSDEAKDRKFEKSYIGRRSFVSKAFKCLAKSNATSSIH